jgi:hypothetical protein
MSANLTLTMTDDRRNLPRRPINGHAMAVFSTGPTTTRIARVELVDASWTGIGLKTAEPIEEGVSVSLTPEDAMWPRQIGVVVRCEKLEDGTYHLGLLSRRAKAAVA